MTERRRRYGRVHESRIRMPFRPLEAMLVGVVLVVSTIPGVAAPPPAPRAPGPQADVPVLVSTEWVAAHLDDRDVLLVAVAMGHGGLPEHLVPGSVFLDYHAIEISNDLPIELPPAETLVEVFRDLGVSDDTHVVLYGPAPAHIAARAFVTLEYLGHDRVSVMDGGIEAWRADGRPTVPTPVAPPRGNLQARVDTDVVVDADWIAERLGDPGVALIDARPPAQFEGPSNRGLRPGHIPGAGNLYFVDLLGSEEVHRLKAPEEARALFEAAGAAEGDTVVSYCQIGMRASYNYLVARHLGYDVKLYDGSWVDWGSRTDLPAETGPARR